MLLSRATNPIKRWIDEGWNQGKLEVVEQVFMPNCVEYGITHGLAEYQGHAELKQRMQGVRKAFPDLRLEIMDTVTEGDKLVIRFVAGGTHKGEWLEVPASGKYITWGGVFIAHLLGTKVQELWTASDLYGQLQQIKTGGPIREARR